MKFKLTATAKVCILVASAYMGATGIANAQSSTDLAQQIQIMQAQLKAMQAQLDQQAKAAAMAATAPAPAAAAPMASASADHEYIERKKGDGMTILTRGGELTAYGNLDISLDNTTKGVNSSAVASLAKQGYNYFGNGGWMPAISTNNAFVGLKGFQALPNSATKFVYQLETQIDISATSGTGNTNSNTSNVVKGGLTSRNSFVGLADSAWGAVKIGKTDAPYKTSTASMNPFAGMLGDYAVVMGNTGGDNRVEFGTRLDHSIWWESPNMSGVTVNALMSPGQNRGYDSSNIAAGESDCAGGNTQGSGGTPIACNDGAYGAAYSLNAAYRSGGLYMTGAYELHQKVNRTSDLGSYDANDIANESAVKLGAQYKFSSTGTTVNAIIESMKRGVPQYLMEQNERQRTGFWLAVSQDLTSKDSVHFGWAHANKAAGDPGTHTSGTPTGPLGLGFPGADNSANMFTLAWKHQVDKNFSYYADWATTINHQYGHYDLGAGGRGVTTDCHDASTPNDATGFDPSNGGPRCYSGTHLSGVSAGIKYIF